MHPACDPLKALPKNTQLGIAGGVLVALALLVYLGPSGDVNEPARVAAPVNHGFSSDRDVASCAPSKSGGTKVIDSGCWGTLATMTSASESNGLTDVGVNPNAGFSGVSNTPRVSTLPLPPAPSGGFGCRFDTSGRSSILSKRFCEQG